MFQESDGNKKRKSIEPPDYPTHSKIANVTPTDASNDSPENKTEIKNVIYNLLTKSQRGKLILAAYEYDKANNNKFKKFNSYAHKLAGIIIDNEFMNGHHDIKRNRFLVLRNWICEQFEEQIPEQWYSVSTSTTSATGYLYTAYRGLRDQCIELGIFKGSVKEKSKPAMDTDVDTVDIFEATNIDDDLINKWTSLFDNRKKCYKNGELVTLLTLYPCLAFYCGYELILADFKRMYGSRSEELKVKWPEVSIKIVDLAGQASANPAVKATIDKYQKLLAVSKEIVAFLILPIMLKPSNNHIVKKGCTLRIEDYLDVFIYEAKGFNDLEDCVDFANVHRHLENIYENIEEESVKPYIVICGTFSSISSIYVVLSKDCKYKVDSLIIAVDIYMKFCLIVCKAVSKPCKALCQFFEYFIYETNNKGIYKSVSNLVQKLSQIK